MLKCRNDRDFVQSKRNLLRFYVKKIAKMPAERWVFAASTQQSTTHIHSHVANNDMKMIDQLRRKELSFQLE
jgi:hypothetical protein